ncbi:Alpha-L-fucosidase [Acidisarcina polymorpha]|uniref:alpha-L-fucosidase n=2 Tax=Acidisarcina polymorpha TaxID=2211140 RepID=A0A2Z5G4R6_9BACT|nr:Alpha-L-fucosidase [Acidisarcina polymorpha]
MTKASSGTMHSLSSELSMLELQQRFLNLRFGMYIHLNMATYEQREWGDPKASPALFNPKDLDTDQWARAAKSAGMEYGCLTTKHHDGFCLWPTATSSASVKDATYKKDVVRAYVDSFRAQGLKTCLYFSMLDLRRDIRPYCVTREKIDLVKTQLNELLTNYGEITALVIDGWNAAWSRLNYEEMPFLEIYRHVKQLQPTCLMSDYNQGRFPAPALFYTDVKQYEQHAGQTIPAGSNVPSQSATTLQRDWFWKLDYPTQELRAAKQIVEEWLEPFNARYCNLILNVAPNREGRFDQNAVDRLVEIGKLWRDRKPAARLTETRQIISSNLAFGRPSYASSIADTSGPDLANDNDPGTYWQCDAGQTSGWIEIDLRKPTSFNKVAVVEPTYLSDYGAESRIVSYRIEAWNQGQWREICMGNSPTTMVYRVKPAIAERVRLSIRGTGKSPGIAEFGLFAEPERV